MSEEPARRQSSRSAESTRRRLQRRVLADWRGVYIPPEVLEGAPAVPVGRGTERALPPARQLGLTARQREVLALMMQGMSNKTICRRLDVAEPTVKNHVTAILRALGANNRTEAVVAAGALMLPKDGGTL